VGKLLGYPVRRHPRGEEHLVTYFDESERQKLSQLFGIDLCSVVGMEFKDEVGTAKTWRDSKFALV
jgi:hypothetical protein